MRKIPAVLLPLLFLFILPLSAQKKVGGSVPVNGPGKKSFESIPADPLKTRIYTLSNGMKVYMSVYKDAPRIHTFIAVKAGSKNDPKDATGLAHYLEHMLFKGTDKYGTLDYAKEAPLVQKVEDLYEVYRKTKDETERKKLYRQIDSISGEAARFAIANEYDKMIAAMGCDANNAFTSFEQTVYVNDIPSNQLENWVTIEAERFRNPVMRIFHTELEAVYEEKNRSLDDDANKVEDAIFSNLFPHHTYGTQTTIGTIEHLKNPSIREIRKYYAAHYVPNNMAIVLSGDLDPDKTIKLLEEKFGSMKPKEVPKFTFTPEKPLTKPVVKEVFGPEAESVTFAYRFGGVKSSDPDMLKLIAKILYNGKAGLMDLNLNQKQLLVGSSCGEYILKDYSVLFLDGYPEEGQSLDEVRKLVLGQVEELKKGNFSDWMLKAIVNQMKLDNIHRLGSNYGRASEMLGSFVKGTSWKDEVEEIDRISKITKQQVIDFAKKNLKENYVVAYKRRGEDSNVQKVEKPAITPVEVNRDKESPFLKAIVNNIPPPIEPVFADYDKDILKLKLKNGLQVNYLANKENSAFELYYVFNMGNSTDPMWPLAIRYLQFLGTKELSAAQMAQEFYKLGCSFDVYSGDDRIYVSLSGLTENFEKGLELFEKLLTNVQPDEAALKGLVATILKERDDDKLNKDVILRQAMVNYGKHGPENPFTNILSAAKLESIKATELTDMLKKLESFDHRILYFGDLPGETVAAQLTKYHPMNELQPVPPLKQYDLKLAGGDVYVVDFDMKQAEIIMLGKGQKFDRNLSPDITLYNEYFGGGMSSIVFQDLRESKALAYSAGSHISSPAESNKHYVNVASIGTQADKLPEAMAGMTALLRNMPLSPIQFDAAKAAVVQRLRTERTTKADVLFEYESALKLGIKDNLRKEIFGKVQNISMSDISYFQEKNIKSMSYTILVIGKKSDLDIKTLEKYGKVTFLSLKDVFGY
jgi:zinc protease